MEVSLRGLCLLSLVAFIVLSASALGDTNVRNKRDSSPKRKLRVVSIEAIPYTMKAKGFEGVYNSSGVGYIGFIPDLLLALEKRLNLEIEFYMSPDQKYGALNKNTNQWTGMIGEVIKKENDPTQGADMAAAPLTMTASREKVVDFIKSFQHHGLNMLIKKPESDPKKDIWEYTFDIVKPLSGEVWACCSIGVIVVGLLLWANNRFNPYEWGGRHNLGRAPEAASESFNLQGSMWFAFTTLQWQGFERAPRSLSAKTLTCFWFIFVSVTLITYTGSLVNHLFWASTVHGKDPTKHDIRTLADLVKNPDYDYGYIEGGATARYFNEIAEGAIFDQMRAHWDVKKTSHVGSSSEGLNRVRRENYVFFCEKYTAEYYANLKPCDVMTTGELIGHRAYGFAVPHNMDHQLSEDLHAAVLEMMEEGDVEALEHKWWKAKGECWDVSEKERKISQQSALYINKPKVITLSMFWGPLVLLCVGIVLTILVAIAEIMFYKYKGRYQRGNRPGDSKLQMDDDNQT